MDKVLNLGQVWTTEDIVKKMFELSKTGDKILEPSAGRGAFTDYIKLNSSRQIDSVEFDEDNSREDFIMCDFFDFGEHNKYSLIIGNPPYVASKNIHKETLGKIQQKSYLSSFDNRTNLYIYFIRKCLEHLQDDGELIFITPREFIKATSAIKLNNLLAELGTITHWYEYGDQIVFPGFNPTVVVWRFQKGDFSRLTHTNDGDRVFSVNSGQISFTKNSNSVKFSDLFFVKVGAVSGMDTIFTSEKGNCEFVCSYTKSSNKLKRMFFNIIHEDLIQYKSQLIYRKIKKFDESNWWQWGRGLYESDVPRIYVNCKTRDQHPFFTHDCKYYDGSVLAIFPKNPHLDINIATQLLNSVDWNELGFKVGGRLCFTQKSLENTRLPDIFKKLIQ
jgi:adenine-specific DNA-methyltransferase